MTVDLPTAFNVHQGDPDTDPLRVANVGSPANTASKANGGVSLDNQGQAWQESTVGVLSGIRWEFVAAGTAQDLTSPHELFVIAAQVNAPNRVQMDTVANEGMSVRLYSSSDGSNYRAFYVAGSNSIFGKFRSAPTSFMVDPNAAGDADSGTYDATAVENYSFQARKANQAGSGSQWSYVSEAWRIGTTKTVANIPRLHGSGVKMADLPEAVEGIDQSDIKHVFCATLSSGIYFVGCPFAIGNVSQGNTITVLTDDGLIFISPADKDAKDPRYHLTTDAMRVHIDLRNNAADRATLTGTYIWGTAAPWDFDYSGLGDVFITGAKFQGMGDFTLGASVSGGATFDLASGSDVIINGATITNSVVNGDCQLLTATHQLGLTINGDLVFDAGAADIVVSFTNCTVTGDITNAGTGKVTLNNIGGNAMTTSEPGAGDGQVLINRNVFVTVTVNDENGAPLSGASVFVEAAAGGPLTVGTEIMKAFANASGVATISFPYTADQPMTYRAREIGPADRHTTVEGSGTILDSGFQVVVALQDDE